MAENDPPGVSYYCDYCATRVAETIIYRRVIFITVRLTAGVRVYSSRRRLITQRLSVIL